MERHDWGLRGLQQHAFYAPVDLQPLELWMEPLHVCVRATYVARFPSQYLYIIDDCISLVNIFAYRERETLHLFQPPRADQMPDPHQGQCHNILPSIP